MEKVYRQKSFHYLQFKKYENKYKELSKKLENICSHVWEIDSANHSPKTHRECKKCFAYR